jgi:hypothetical protein
VSANKGDAAIVGVGVVACAACCAGPIVGMLAAVGISSALGFALLGGLALALGATAVVFVVLRRRRRQAVGCASMAETVPVALGQLRSRP